MTKLGGPFDVTFKQFTFEEQNVGDRLAHEVGCVAQDKVLNLAYTIGIFCVGFSAFIWGFLIDRLGLRIIRLLLNCIITTGTILLSVTTKRYVLILYLKIARVNKSQYE
ncbi:uncharacterized protein CEXT_18181 [Caerostris extrusa]|uniref:Major facilitator superfamily (MFS) profile domain-containing protein n=1 Tax=Caerostris extrusa TaxID=172846 RepID=A0AAV4M2B9_CAEEX|nr:uncharacterized protein CEXT_18181 [Caerostris extrusa]